MPNRRSRLRTPHYDRRRRVVRLGGVAASTYADKVLGYGPDAFWPLDEAAGAVANELVNGWNGATAGATVGQPGIGDGGTSYLFDGINDTVNIFSAPLSAIFDEDEGSAAIWFKVFNVGVWTDAVFRGLLMLAENGNDFYTMTKTNAAGTLKYQIGRFGAGYRTVNKAGIVAVDWVHIAMTWSKTNNQMIAYWAGAPEGAPQPFPGGWLGTLTNGFVNIGSFGPGAVSVWHGWLAHAAVWAGTVLTAAQIADLATL